jgi:hypothetical protein
VVRNLDDLLFTIDHGRFASVFFCHYFIECEKTTNRLFLDKFESLAKSSPETSCREITEKALRRVRKELNDSEFAQFHADILPFCAPDRFAKTSPDPPERERQNADIALLSAAESTELEERSPAEQKQSVQGGKQSTRSHKKRSQAASDLQTGHRKTTRANKDAALKVDKKGHNDLGAECTISELLDTISDRLKSVSARDLVGVVHKQSTLLERCRQELHACDSKKEELQDRLQKLSERGLIHCEESFGQLVAATDELSVAEARERLQKYSSQAAAVLETSDRYLVLVEDLGQVGTAPPLATQTADLNVLLEEADRQMAAMEDCSKKLHQSDSILLGLEETICSCDFEAAQTFVEESNAEQWLSVIRAYTVCVSAAQKGGVAETSRRQGPSAVVSLLFGEHKFLSLVVSFTWSKSSEVAVAMLYEIFQRAEVLGSGAFGGALAGLTFDQLLQVAESAPELSRPISEMIFLVSVHRKDFDLIAWLQSLERTEGNPNHFQKFLREVTFAQEQGHLLEELRNLFDVSPKSSNPSLTEEAALKALRDHAAVHGLSGNYHRLREVAQEKFVRPIMDLVDRRKVQDVLGLWRSFKGLDGMVQQCGRAVGAKYRLEKSHYNKTREYLVHFEELL